MKDLIFSNGEVSLLVNNLRKGVIGDGTTTRTDRAVLYVLIDALGEILKKYRTLSEGYLEVLMKKYVKNSIRYSREEGYPESISRISQVLFREELDKMPLFMNDSLVGHIATFRLKVGK